MNCEYCGTAMKALFTSNYCPNDCDKNVDNVSNYLKSALKPFIGTEISNQELLTYQTPITKILEDYAIKEIQEEFDNSLICIKEIGFVNSQTFFDIISWAVI